MPDHLWPSFDPRVDMLVLNFPLAELKSVFAILRLRNRLENAAVGEYLKPCERELTELPILDTGWRSDEASLMSVSLELLLCWLDCKLICRTTYKTYTIIRPKLMPRLIVRT